MSSPRKSRAPFDPRTWLAALRSAQPQDAYERGVAALDARYAPALFNLGNLSLEDGRIDEAIEYYQAALRADDQYSGAHRNMGIACKRIGRHADAVRHLRIATRLEIRQAMKRRR